MKKCFFISKIILVLMFASEASAEEVDIQPVVESDSITAETTEHNIPCIRCEKKNQLDIQVLGIINTPLGISGISFTRHLLDRTSVQGGIGYGFGGVNVSAAALHYLEKDQSFYISTGLSLTSEKTKKHKERKECKKCKGRKTYRSDHYDDKHYSRDDDTDSEWDANELEGLWVNVGFGADILTQSGLSYGLDFGLSMAILSDVLSSDIKLCFGALAADSCQSPWRFMPYLTLLKLGYSW